MKEKTNNVFFIENPANKDLLGYDSYVDSLRAVIEDGANYIGVVSDYGSGKSTLIRRLKESYEVDEKEKTKVITINLWNCEDKFGDLNKFSIHRNFIHQLIDQLDIDNKKYYKKKIDKNYSLFDIKIKGKNFVYAYLLGIVLIMSIFDKLSFFDMFPESFTGTGYMLISAYILLNFFIYSPLIAIRKAEADSRTIDENETRDLYEEIMRDYFGMDRRKFLFKEKKEIFDKIIISLEEIDRYEDENLILSYIKEFYKFYSENKILEEKIVFIVSVKPSYNLGSVDIEFEEERKKDNEGRILIEKDEAINKNTKKAKEIYEKVFDYILNLRQVNIQDFDAIIIDLLKEKKDLIPDEIKLPTISNMGRWQYLYKGSNIKIRDIKHRYNFAMSLYLSLKENKFSPSINKCLFVSYLEDEYPDLYRKISSNSSLLNSILNEYSLSKKIFKNEKDSFNIEEEKVLIEGLETKEITVDCYYYFYKFPVVKETISIDEILLSKALLYDEEMDGLYKSIEKLDDKKILKYVSNRPNKEVLPSVIFSHPRLFELCLINKKKELLETIKLRYLITTNLQESENFIKKAKRINRKNYIDFVKIYSEIIIPELNKVSPDGRQKMREVLILNFNEEIAVFKNLFFGENLLISESEIEQINNFDTLCDLTNFDKIEDTCLPVYANKINDAFPKFKPKMLEFIEEVSSKEQISFDKFEDFINRINLNQFSKNQISKLFDVISRKLKFDLNLDKAFSFVNKTNFYNKKIDSFLVDILKINEDESLVKKYVKVLNDNSVLFKDSGEFLNSRKTFYSLNADIRNKMFEYGYYKYYVVSTRLNEKIFDIEIDKFELLEKVYIDYFESKPDVGFEISDRMKEFLYKNTNIESLSPSQLYVFKNFEQTKDIIKSVIDTDEFEFINNYLRCINKMRRAEMKEIFEIIGKYNIDNQLRKGTLKKIRSIPYAKNYNDYLHIGKAKKLFQNA